MPMGRSVGSQQTTDLIIIIIIIIIVTRFGDNVVASTLVEPQGSSGRITHTQKETVTFFIKYYSGSKSTKYLLPAM